MKDTLITEKLVINDIKKETRQSLVMDEVTIKVHKGEIYALVGKAGSGKTLLSKIILKLVRKTDGKATVVGSFGTVVQQQNFYPEKSGFATLQYYALVNIKAISRNRIANTMNLLGLKSVMHRAIETYSASQLARLKIAVSLVSRPEVLILDEPFLHLSDAEAREVRFVLKSLADKEQVAIFITTEDLANVEEICDTVGIIDDGMMITTKSYNELIANDAPYTKISISTPTPNYAAKLIEENLNFQAYLCGSMVIVNTPSSNAQQIADELLAGGIEILQMQRVNRSLQEQYFEIVNARRGIRI